MAQQWKRREVPEQVYRVKQAAAAAASFKAEDDVVGFWLTAE